jgi:hypothetical protein
MTPDAPRTETPDLRAAAEAVSRRASVRLRPGSTRPSWVIDDATFSALRAALSIATPAPLDERDETERDIAFRAAKMSRTPPEEIRAAIEALRGPMDRNEAIAIGCAYAVLWAHEEVARLTEAGS